MIDPLVSFPNIEAFLDALAVEPLSRYWMARADHEMERRRQAGEALSLWERGLPPIVSTAALGLLLGISSKLITSMSYNPERYWRAFTIRKKAGGTRLIVTPRVFLKVIHWYLLQTVLMKLPVSERAYGFVPQRGARANAEEHLGQRFIWCIDIRDFFPTIRQYQVAQVFLGAGFDASVAGLLSRLCTYSGHLAQGAPTSPQLSNLIFRDIDDYVAAAARSAAITYTRYADDLTFSSMVPIPTGFTREIAAHIERHGYSLNPEKQRMRGPRQRRVVTGFAVSQKVQPPRELRRSLRARFHNVANGKIVDEAEKRSLQGWASYVFDYDADLGRSYLQVAANAVVRNVPGS
jgi:RNA-directed DNA polymerase